MYVTQSLLTSDKYLMTHLIIEAPLVKSSTCIKIQPFSHSGQAKWDSEGTKMLIFTRQDTDERRMFLARTCQCKATTCSGEP